MDNYSNRFVDELWVAGVILLDPDRLLPLIRAELCLDDFRSREGRAVFEAACRLADDACHLDLVTICKKAEELGVYISMEDTDKIMGMVNVPFTVGLDTHICGVKQERLRAELLTVVTKTQTMLVNGAPPEDTYVILQEDVTTAISGHKAANIISSAESLAEFYQYKIDTNDRSITPFVRTRYMNLDNALGGGFMQEGLYIIAARPGCGKSTLGLQIADKVAQFMPVLFVSMEMSRIQLTARRIAAESKLSITKLLAHRLNDEENQKVVDVMEVLNKRKLWFNENAQETVSSIGVQARRIEGCGLVVVDYLGLIQHEEGRTLYEQVTKTSNSLKRLARTLKIPIVCLAQLNREVTTRQRGATPRLSDLRDSGAIEQDADGVILLYEIEGEGNTGPGAPKTLICEVAKNRHGPAGRKVPMHWYKEIGDIRLIKTDYPEYPYQD